MKLNKTLYPGRQVFFQGVFLVLFGGLFGAYTQVPADPEGFEYVGSLKTRSAKKIANSTWSIGGETLDRDYADYHAYKQYLGPLGAKRIRLQGGWAKCERVKGQYDFTWLDGIIDDVVSQGVQPWVSFSYGNPIYPGGGEAKLGGGLPSSPEALRAWDNWVRAVTERYKDKVPEWEIWNEPNLSASLATGTSYVDFYIRTAEIVRSVQPEARLFALALAGIGQSEFVAEFFDVLKQRNKLHLVDVVTYHGYSPNPDDHYPNVKALRDLVYRYKPKIEFMQGENGCPSTPSSITVGALRQHDWTELSQAKWLLRRMLGDHGRGIATNVFTLSDLHYKEGDHFAGVNSKGLLKTYADKTIDRPKLAYYAVQRVMGLFDEHMEISSDTRPELDRDHTAVFQYRHEATGGTVLTLWNNADRPAESFKPEPTQITVIGKLDNPVWVDLVSGKVFRIPASAIESVDGKRTIKNIPIPDYPILVADQSAIPYQECRYTER